MVDGDSADVWARQYQFRLDASIGAPPDAFSVTGQNWGMPLYRWDVIAAEQIPRVGGHRRDVERPRGIAREVELRIRNGDDLAPRVALTAGQMRVTRPRAGARHAHPNLVRGRHLPLTLSRAIWSVLELLVVERGPAGHEDIHLQRRVQVHDAERSFGGHGIPRRRPGHIESGVLERREQRFNRRRSDGGDDIQIVCCPRLAKQRARDRAPTA